MSELPIDIQEALERWRADGPQHIMDPAFSPSVVRQLINACAAGHNLFHLLLQESARAEKLQHDLDTAVNIVNDQIAKKHRLLELVLPYECSFGGGCVYDDVGSTLCDCHGDSEMAARIAAALNAVRAIR